jgi:hypothetical protein
MSMLRTAATIASARALSDSRSGQCATASLVVIVVVVGGGGQEHTCNAIRAVHCQRRASGTTRRVASRRAATHAGPEGVGRPCTCVTSHHCTPAEPQGGGGGATTGLDESCTDDDGNEGNPASAHAARACAPGSARKTAPTPAPAPAPTPAVAAGPRSPACGGGDRGSYSCACDGSMSRPHPLGAPLPPPTPLSSAAGSQTTNISMALAMRSALGRKSCLGLCFPSWQRGNNLQAGCRRTRGAGAAAAICDVVTPTTLLDRWFSARSTHKWDVNSGPGPIWAVRPRKVGAVSRSPSTEGGRPASIAAASQPSAYAASSQQAAPAVARLGVVSHRRGRKAVRSARSIVAARYTYCVVICPTAPARIGSRAVYGPACRQLQQCVAEFCLLARPAKSQSALTTDQGR